MPESPTTFVPASPHHAFKRAHKSALGLAFGVMFGGAFFLLTAIHVVLKIDGLPLGLLNQYFQGYDVTWNGAFVGLAWGFIVGFVGGWLLGFVHNFTVAVWMLVALAKQDLRNTRNFLDHI